MVKFKKQDFSQLRENYKGAREWLNNWYAQRLPLVYWGANPEEVAQTSLDAVSKVNNTIDGIPIYDTSNLELLNRKQKKVYDRNKYDTTLGYYTKDSKGNPYIVINDNSDYTIDPSLTAIHELNHAVQGQIRSQLYRYSNNIPIKPNSFVTDYLVFPREAHSRLMELRKYLNLDPTKQNYDEQWLNSDEVQKALIKFQLNHFTNEELLNMFNNWAYNSPQSENKLYYAKQGVKLLKRNGDRIINVYY